MELFWPLLLTTSIDFFGATWQNGIFERKKGASVLPEGFLRNLPSSLASWQSNQVSRVVVERERERGRATHHETKYVSKWVVMYIILQVYRVKICSFLLIESHCTYIRKWLSSHPTSNRECVFFLVLFFGNTPATHVGWIPTIELIVATWGMSPSYLETLWLRNCKWQSMFQGCLIHSWVN